ncbi:hypothetical protein A3C05_03400 [Candidatus Giovannonibacteria bacterium RIFCSPHIGHO2_02_FULL_45_40]|uniref:Uncharacterized protein n=1 Tax=Candidatus Giovannonibacteria bacterium RIFCSPHIGHO2_02_FULL_45_40 TaxID=1798337 RepID=A0A1F5WA96_9BACT|nr:MAG: hypothetical protein A2656_01125 [Candidatus Giovannonibacteria bacterium RIFCSPHIGHO2_01_FULL_44_100]OGF72586.1 MAG: hypothetical protein A3C05_03400 [Candidatus Giovannonibacteria bacterium RIFCSPHIGHO2_02_FULL_45_40]
MFEIVRWSTFAATAFLAVFGYSDQLRLIFSHKSTVGLSFVMVLISFWSWASYTLYGWFHGDKKIFWPNLVGTIFISLILVSFLIY